MRNALDSTLVLESRKRGAARVHESFEHGSRLGTPLSVPSPPPLQYDAVSTGTAGGGGEYEVQTGFGWSNGVVIEFMNLFGDELLREDDGVDAKFVKEEEEKTNNGN